ncbi:hypothetical protein HDEF_2077 [Candidatus Hamiltonella defensa 5AT (Acyrthosiphon pisum)]|uniref:Uncharacterized protein n=1 Tax=Hamiltonella defensa subsp. Acyrthosiphon pisum (strain 5AT) TaxID=572265 RepID=C4K7V1_HAMD5|nr:hypothetical protein HDEF_2077 [Candidatus Hamiltonella defensa 5AT (Acyrthosiphon pisum)]
MGSFLFLEKIHRSLMKNYFLNKKQFLVKRLNNAGISG